MADRTAVLTVVSVAFHSRSPTWSASPRTAGRRRSACRRPACTSRFRSCAARCRGSATTGVGISLIGEQAIRGSCSGRPRSRWPSSVTGAYLGSIISYIAMSAYCMVMLRYAQVLGTGPRCRRAAGAGTDHAVEHVRRAWAPIAGLAVIACCRTSTSSPPSIASRRTATSTPPSRSRPRCLSGWPSAPASTSSPRSRAGGPRAQDTRPCCSAHCDHRRLRDPVPADLRGGAAAADPDRVRGQEGHRRPLRAAATRAPRSRLSGDLPRDPVHARAQADLVPDRDRGGCDRRADLLASRLPGAAGFASSCSGSRRSARSAFAWHCVPIAPPRRPGRAENPSGGPDAGVVASRSEHLPSERGG